MGAAGMGSGARRHGGGCHLVSREEFQPWLAFQERFQVKCVQTGLLLFDVLLGMPWVWKGQQFPFDPQHSLCSLRTYTSFGQSSEQVWALVNNLKVWKTCGSHKMMELSGCCVLGILGIYRVSRILTRSSLTKAVWGNTLFPWHNFQPHSSGPALTWPEECLLGMVPTLGVIKRERLGLTGQPLCSLCLENLKTS